MTKTYGPDVVPDPEELVPWMEATAAEHQRRRFEEEPFGATIVSMEEFREMIAAGYFDRVPAEPGLMRLRGRARRVGALRYDLVSPA
jgi:hypothetical protein